MKKPNTRRWAKSLAMGAMCLFSYSGFALTQYSSSTTWTNANSPFNDDVQVLSGATLTIQSGAYIHMNGHIYIEPGAQVYIDNGATLQMAGDKVIQLRSIYAYSPLPANTGGILTVDHGTITSQNGSTRYFIEVEGMNPMNTRSHSQALSAMFTCNYANINYATIRNSTLTSGQVDGSGGIIRGFHSTYKMSNVESLLEMANQMQYTSGQLMRDKSNFVECNFICDRAQPTQKDMIYLLHVEGVTFSGCQFSESNTGVALRAGIYAQDAGFIVKDACGGAGPYYGTGWYHSGCGLGAPIRSYFSLFRGTAILGQCFGEVHSAAIDHCTFGSCTKSINLHSYTLPLVIGNDIYLIAFNNSKLNYGINIVNSQIAAVEENFVYDHDNVGWIPPQTSTNFPAIGIISQDLGGAPNRVFGNHMIGCDYAFESIGKNRGNGTAVNVTGLKYLCNWVSYSTYNSYDFLVAETGYPNTPAPSTINSGIDPVQAQGTPGNPFPADNHFAPKSATTLPRDFDNTTGNAIDYYYFISGSGEKPLYHNLNSLAAEPVAGDCAVIDYHAPTVVSYPQFLSNKGSVDVGTSNTSANLILLNNDNNIRNIVASFMYRDTDIIYVDSLEMVLANSDYLYEYQLERAKMMVTQGNYQDAIDLISGLHNSYTMMPDEETAMQNLAVTYSVAKALAEHNDDWSLVDPMLKSSLADVAATDQYFARHIARDYLSIYEAAAYDDDFIWEDISGKPGATAVATAAKNSSVYPNPAKDVLNIEVNATCLHPEVTITDVTGKVIRKYDLHAGQNTIDIHDIARGVYVARISNDGITVDQQKIVKL